MKKKNYWPKFDKEMFLKDKRIKFLNDSKRERSEPNEA